MNAHDKSACEWKNKVKRVCACSNERVYLCEPLFFFFLLICGYLQVHGSQNQSCFQSDFLQFSVIHQKRKWISISTQGGNKTAVAVIHSITICKCTLKSRTNSGSVFLFFLKAENAPHEQDEKQFQCCWFVQTHSRHSVFTMQTNINCRAL